MKKNRLLLGILSLIVLCTALMQGCTKPISAELPPPPATFKAKVNSKTWITNSTVSGIIQHDPISGCATLTLTGVKVIDANNPLSFEQVAVTVNLLNAFTTDDLCIPTGNYYEINNNANPTIGCTGGGNNGRIFSMGLYTQGTNIVSNGTDICTVKITSCKQNAISGTFSFKGTDNATIPATVYNVTGGTFTDVPLVKVN